jgi:hypothetical protein
MMLSPSRKLPAHLAFVVDNHRQYADEDSLAAHSAESARKRGSWLSILLAAIAGLVVCAGLFLLMLQFGGPLAVVAVLVFGLGGVIALFHYLVWGWWLGRTIREEVEAEERDRQA